MTTVQHEVQTTVGDLVRRWRTKRRRSQLDVSIAADLSARHLSFIETGRATPSRTMIERLCAELDVPLRERNAFYLAAGFAPVHSERPLDDLGPVRDAVQTVLAGHAPNPALAVNLRWELLAANDSAELFLGDVAAHLRQRPMNVLRATLHPDGLGPHIRNYAQWRAHLVRRVRRQLERTADPGLDDLLAEIRSYPVPDGADTTQLLPHSDFAMRLLVSTDYGDLSLLYATTVFGSPRDVTLDEVAIETFFPADDATKKLLAATVGQ